VIPVGPTGTVSVAWPGTVNKQAVERLAISTDRGKDLPQGGTSPWPR
jgi:hypothetical protein